MSYNPYEEWVRHDPDEFHLVSKLFDEDNPVVSGADTETTGLHLIADRPFLIIFGWLIPCESHGRVFTFYPTQKNMEIFFKLAKKTKMFIWHNTTYDLSMMKNIGWDYDGNNLVENMVLARLSLEALTARLGGDSLKLKQLGVKYVHPDAAKSEAMVKEALKELKDARVKVLTAALKQFDHPYVRETKPYRLDTGKKTTSKYAANNPDNVEWKNLPKKWNKGLLEDFLKDITHDVSDLPKDVREVWENWLEEYPEPTYADVDRKVMIQYACEDVITMLEFAKRTFAVLKERKQQSILKQENKLIPIISSMERHGLRVDRVYLEQCRKDMKALIIKKRKEMYKIAGSIVNVGQDKTILNVFENNWNIHLFQCNKAMLKKIVKGQLDQEVPEEAKLYAKYIMDLRRLEKWYSTYVVRVLERSAHDGRLYLQLNQAGAVSGRFTSDGQQFPKAPVEDSEGEVVLNSKGEPIFHPRRAFLADEDTLWYFLDYSQIELRNQANYTILVSGGDLNLCRAYMPFKCEGEHKGTKGVYNFKDPDKRKYWKLQNFWKDEKGDLWTPTDVHGQTTHNALVLLNYDCKKLYEDYTYMGEGKGFFGNHLDKDKFKEVRSKGKTFNFAKNYGVGLAGAMDQLNFPEYVAQALIDGYEKAFPGVIDYQQMVEQQHWTKGYVKNMYGRRYYLEDLRKSYVLNNYLIQGTCADLLKESTIRVYEYLQSIKCKTKMIMNIHDEIQFTSVPGEEHIIRKCKELMEDHPWHLVPIVCDMEVTTGAWSDKEEVA